MMANVIILFCIRVMGKEWSTLNMLVHSLIIPSVVATVVAKEFGGV